MQISKLHGIVPQMITSPTGRTTHMRSSSVEKIANARSATNVQTLRKHPYMLPTDSTEAKPLILPGLMACQACPLYGMHRKRVVPGFGPRPSRIMFVGQNPGREEDLKARPLVGESGQLLRRELARIGMNLDDYYSTNAVHCMPPNLRTPEKGEVNTCSTKWLMAEVDAVDPDIIVPMGALAYRVFLPESEHTSGITQVQGSVFKRSYRGRDRFIIPTVNPAFVVGNEDAHLPALRRAIANIREIHDKGFLDTGVIPFRKTEATWSEVFHIAKHADFFGLDLETTGLHRSSQILGLGLCAEPGNGCYYPFESIPEVYSRLEEIRGYLDNPDRPKVVSNAKFERQVLWHGGTELNSAHDPTTLEPYDSYKIRLRGYHDTLIMAWILGNVPLGLKDGFHHVFGVEPLELLDYGSGFEIKDWHGDKAYDFRLLFELRRGEMVRYSAQDPDMSLRLFSVLRDKLIAANQMSLYEDLELPFMEAIISMEENGVKFDASAMGDVPAQVQQLVRESLVRAEEIAGFKWNPNSAPQAATLLYDTSGPYQIKPVIRRGVVEKKTDKVTLGEHYENPLVRVISTHRAIIKYQGYVKQLPTWVQPHTGRIHAEIKQTGTGTGRVSTAKPNVQQIPARKRDDIDVPLNPKALRRAFVAADGHYLLAPDLSQIEMRLAAHLSGDETMIRLFNEGADFHTNTAMEIYGTTLAQLLGQYGEYDGNARWDNMRYLAKTVNFGTAYGLTDVGLVQRTPSLNLTKADAKRFIDTFYNAYPGFRDWQQEIKRFGQRNGYAETMLGRRRYLTDLTNRDKIKREEAFRAAINVPIQGSAADLFKLCVNSMRNYLIAHDLKTKLIMQVHDEIVMEVPFDELDIVAPAALDIMVNIYPLRVPIKADVEYGPNWADLKKWKPPVAA